jgi:hypothetical protein
MASKTSTGIQYSERTMNGIIDINADSITSNTINSNTITADNLLEADVAETITANKWSFVYPPNLINPPLDSNDAANKGYVDTAISTINLAAYQLTSTNTLTNLLARSTYGGGYGMTSMGTITIGLQSTFRTTIANNILTNKNYNGTTDDFIIMDNTTGINALIVAKYVKNAPVKIFGVDIGQNIITGYDSSTFLPLRFVSLNGVKITIGAYNWLFKTDGTLSFPDASIQSTAFIPANYYTSTYIDSNFYTSTYIDSNFLTTAIAAFTYQPVIDMVNYYTKLQADTLFLTNPSLVDIVVNGITIGRGTGNQITNTALGVDALKVVSSGINNTATGYFCLDGVTTGGGNCGYGAETLQALVSGSSNCAFGRNALRTTTASSNTAVGFDAGFSNLGGSENCFYGRDAGRLSSSGLRNNYIGNECAYNATGSANFNNYIGYRAGYNKTNGNFNVAIGYSSMYGATNNTMGNQTAVGSYTLYSVQSAAIEIG